MTDMKTIEKKFVKIDDDCYNQIETREMTTPINIAMFLKNMEWFKKNQVSEIITINKAIGNVVLSCDKYNEAIDDLILAKEELGMDFEIPEKISYDSLDAESKIETLDTIWDAK